MRLVAAAAFLALASCSSFSPRMGMKEPNTGIPTVGPAAGPDTGIPASDVGARTNARVRQVCRAEPKRNGWIAVEYVKAGGQCARTPVDGGYNGAVLEYYLDRPIGSTMVVCADQGTPEGWRREFTIVEHECPGARVPDGAPTAREIRRER